MNKTIMKTDDAILAKYAEIFVTIKNKRYTMAIAKNFEGKANVKTKEVPKLGSLIVGHKPTAVELSFKMTIYKCTEIFDEVVSEFIKTGVMPRFDIQTSNEDPAAASIGRSTKIYNDCILDGDVLLSMAGSEDDYIEQEINGYCDGYNSPEKFRNPSYM